MRGPRWPPLVDPAPDPVVGMRSEDVTLVVHRSVSEVQSVELPIGPRGLEGWIEWCLDVPAHGGTRVEIAYLVRNEWLFAVGPTWRTTFDAPPQSPEDVLVGYVLPLAYRIDEGRFYRGGRGPTRWRRASRGAGGFGRARSPAAPTSRAQRHRSCARAPS